MNLDELFPRQPIEEYQCGECKKIFNYLDSVYYVKISEVESHDGLVKNSIEITKLCKECILSEFVEFKPIFNSEHKCGELDFEEPIIKQFCSVCHKEINLNNKRFHIVVTEYSFEADYLEYGIKLEYQAEADITSFYNIVDYCEKCYDEIKVEVSLEFIRHLARKKLATS